MKKYLIDNHKKDIFATENYGDGRAILVEDVLEKEKLLRMLYQLDCFEISLTNEGLEFLRKHYSLDRVVEMILIEIQRGVDYKFTNKSDLIKWLESKGDFSFEGLIRC